MLERVLGIGKTGNRFVDRNKGIVMETYDLKDSGVEWLGSIPIHWGVDRLKDVSHLRDEKTAIKSSDEDYLELEDLSQWTGKILKKRNTLEVASQINVFYEGDVLFGKLRPYLAKYAYVDFNGKCTGEILAIKPTRIYGGFLAYYVGSKHFINHCDNFAYGAKMPRINWNTQMGIFPIPIPPVFEEQKAIADYLDKACQNIDKTIALKQQQLDKLEAYRKSVIHEAVTKGLDKTVPMKDSGVNLFGNIPQAWRMQRIKDIVKTKITDGPHETPQLEESGIPFISAEAIKGDKIDFNKKRGFISQELHEIYSKKCKPQKFDIFIIKSGATTGNVAYVETDIEFNIWSPLALVRCKETLADYKFIYYQFLGDVFKKQIELSWSFGTQENIGMGVLGRIKISLPPIDEQKEIVRYLDNICGKINKTKEITENQIKTLTQYRQSLIHECVTGKKRVYQGTN
jgi:type I restriction enzyme S subunit